MHRSTQVQGPMFISVQLTCHSCSRVTLLARAGFVNTTGFANSNPTNNYTSPSLHHVVLTGLTPNTTYFYQVG